MEARAGDYRRSVHLVSRPNPSDFLLGEKGRTLSEGGIMEPKAATEGEVWPKMTKTPPKPFASEDAHYVVPMVLLCVLCLTAAFSAVLYAFAAKASIDAARVDMDALSARLSSLESRGCCSDQSSNQPIKKIDDNSPRLPDNVSEEESSGGQEIPNGKSISESLLESPSIPVLPDQFGPSDVRSVLLGPRVEHLTFNRVSFSNIPAALLNLGNQWKLSSGESSDISEAIKSDAEETEHTSPPEVRRIDIRSRLKRSSPNHEFVNPLEVEDVSRPDRRRGGSRRRGGARDDPVLRGGHRITGSTQTLALHFDGNTSKYSLGHRHFAGNGRIRHPDGIFKDWRMKDWGSHLSRQHRLQENDGTLTIRESGIYFIYAQVYYLDDHDVNGFLVMVNESPVLQCTTMTHGGGHTKANTCFTGGMVELHAGDTLLLRDVEALRYSIFEPEKSFFGLFRIAHHTSIPREGP